MHRLGNVAQTNIVLHRQGQLINHFAGSCRHNRGADHFVFVANHLDQAALVSVGDGPIDMLCPTC